MKLYTIDRCKYDSVLRCPVCGYEDVFDKLITCSSASLHRDYVSCNCCGLVFSNPLTVPDYADSHSSDLAGHYSYECYVDIGAGIESMIRPLIPLLTNPISNMNNFLDVGCGFGYCVKFASSVMGLKSVGYEPGKYGRLGAKVLNAKIVNKYFQLNSSIDKYSLIFSSEVIEHTPDPSNYISILYNALDTKGIAVLTTPDTNYLHQCLGRNDNSDVKALALLNPGQHLSLFSRESITKLFQKCGISKYKIFEEDGSLIVYFSSNIDLEFFYLAKEQEVKRYYLEFLNHLLNISKTNRRMDILDIIDKIISPFNFIRIDNRNAQKKLIGRFCLGIAYRLMREFTNDGDFKNAHEIEKKYENLYEDFFQKTIYEALESIVTSDIEQCKSPLSILELFSKRKVSFNLYGFLFYKTNLALNHDRDIQTSLSKLILVAKKAIDILDSLFMNLRNSPLSLTWFIEYFRLYPRFCFGLAILYLHADRRQETLVLLDKLLVMIDKDDFETDSKLRPDCILQQAVVFLRNKDRHNLLSCINTLTKDYPEFSQSSELLSNLISNSQELSI